MFDHYKLSTWYKPALAESTSRFWIYHHVNLNPLSCYIYNISPRHRACFYRVFWQARCPIPRLERCNLPSRDIDGSWCIVPPHPAHSFHRKQCNSLPACRFWPLEGNRFVDLRISAVIILQRRDSKCMSGAWNPSIKKQRTQCIALNVVCCRFANKDTKKTRFGEDASHSIASVHPLFNSHRGSDCW